MNFDISWKTFHELTLDELYSILELRQRVFIVEQNCAFLDVDNKDQNAHHLLIQQNKKLIAYLRIFPLNILHDIRFDSQSIIFGRVVVSPEFRSQQLGKVLMKNMLAYCDQHFPHSSIECSAQLYLKKFYESFGFVAKSQEYDEDNILHIDMILEK